MQAVSGTILCHIQGKANIHIDMLTILNDFQLIKRNKTSDGVYGPNLSLTEKFISQVRLLWLN